MSDKIKWSDFNPGAKYVIVGFPKCGQISIKNYLISKGFDVERSDVIWRSNARELIQESHPNYKPVIVMRDPVEMIWSSYWYWHYKDMMSFPAYLLHRLNKETNLGNESPLDHADYDKHIKKFADLDPIILKLEDLIKIQDFPHDNKTWEKPSLPPYFVEMIRSALERNNIATPHYPEESSNS